MESRVRSSSGNPCIVDPMNSVFMTSCTSVEVRPGAVSHTDVATRNVLSLGGAKYSATFFSDASGNVKALHIQLKS